MPYIEILAPSASDAHKRVAVKAITKSIRDGFSVELSTVTIYFAPIAAGDYAHAGSLGVPGTAPRVFVKVHAYRRSLAERRAVAVAMTPAIAECFGTAIGNVAIYFIDREREEVAHGGHMVCDTSYDQILAPTK